MADRSYEEREQARTQAQLDAKARWMALPEKDRLHAQQQLAIAQHPDRMKKLESVFKKMTDAELIEWRISKYGGRAY